jgi:hypothetical protein
MVRLFWLLAKKFALCLHVWGISSGIRIDVGVYSIPGEELIRHPAVLRDFGRSFNPL